jgi:protocatechuate 3,4-dioxygenase beta subunit
MKRKTFLRSLGLASGAIISAPIVAAASVSPLSKLPAGGQGGCSLIPSETPGPFPLDLSDNTFYFRQDITEGRPGIRVIQRMRIVGVDNCQPMSNLRVNLWCCDADGDYSGYSAFGSQGETYMRGYQITDDNGEVEFISILPGWYPGRVVHMHFQVHVSTSFAAVSQFTWPHQEAVDIATNNPTIYPEPDPMTPEEDGVFTFWDADLESLVSDYEHQLATLVWDEDLASFVSDLEVAIEGEGVNGVGYLEREAAKVFSLGDPVPNPISSNSNISLDLLTSSDVEISIYAISGRKVYEKTLGMMNEGNHQITLFPGSQKLSPGAYVFQINVLCSGRMHHDFRRFVVK